MSLKVVQKTEFLEEDYWKWSAWIDGPKEELDEIDHVVYLLHRTFPNPVRTVKNRRTKFRLNSAGWGGFRLVAEIVRKDGSKWRLDHDLVLKYPNGEFAKP